MVKPIQQSLDFAEVTAEKTVRWAGLSFGDDRERQEYFRARLESYLVDYEAHTSVEGFPHGEPGTILSRSDPPYFTLCPNPFLSEFIESYRNNREFIASVEPFVGDLRPTTQHPVHSFHPYHTKVPPEIIRKLIEHYTSPGDTILDGFAGSGMSGVAAAETGRNAILCDLSPVACFIAGVNCSRHDVDLAVAHLENVIAESRQEWPDIYETQENGRALEVNYFVWSDVSSCPECQVEFPFFDHGVVHHSTKVETRPAFLCPQCGAELNVRRVVRVMNGSEKKKRLVWVNAGSGANRVNRAAADFDLELAERIDGIPVPSCTPRDPIRPTGYSAKLAQLGDKGILDVSKFLSHRNSLIFADMWNRVATIEDAGIRTICLATLTSVFTVISERQGYFGGGGGMSGNLYMPIVRMEKNVYDVLRRKLAKLKEAELAKRSYRGSVVVTCQSSTSLADIPDDSIDYIYVDPPFGANIIYSEMNLLLEAWLGVKTNDNAEAVVDPTRDKAISDYSSLLRDCFAEFFRVLKPGRWITVEFHNTSAAVWNAIQTTLGEGGFVIAATNILDKGSTTILGDIRPGSAKHDLLISAYKPSAAVNRAFRLRMDPSDRVWSFLEDLLRHLPIPGTSDGGKASVRQRQKHLLFDRMVAFHVQRGLQVPFSATAFYAELKKRFVERDGIFFLAGQEHDYTRQRATREDPEFAWGEPIIVDEVSAIEWVRAKVSRRPSSATELESEFERVAGGWRAHETRLSIRQILSENFVAEPSRRHSEERDGDNIQWRLANDREADALGLHREQMLLQQFEDVANARHQEPLKAVRTEAVRVGFARAYELHDSATIRRIASILPPDLVQEDATLLMYQDAASKETTVDAS